MKKISGFTLIELLVVIAIIGVLSSVVLASLSKARMSARDAERIANLKQIQIALELYYTDYGYYPPSPCGWDCNNYYYSFNTSWDTFASLLAPYMPSVPKDPINSACGPWADNCFSYVYGNVGRNTWKGYDLLGQFYNQNNPYRCGLRNYQFPWGGSWCTAFGGIYSNFLYKPN